MLTLIIASLLTMSQDDMMKTGVEKLSTKEKIALDSWIEKNYAKKMTSQKGKRGPILQENLNSGRVIGLSDGSFWEVRQSDTPITQGWITPVEIKVTSSDDSDYPYNLTNSLTESTVKAKKYVKK